jgi:hypothetical protein
MSSTKAALKAAKAAIDTKKYADTIKHSKEVLDKDPQNYLGYELISSLKVS